MSARLSDLVRVPARFHRSVHLPADHARGDGPGDSYLVTGAIREAATQILDELEAPKGVRAWTLTGPYGSGKSAFLLFLADLFGRENPKHPEARRLREERRLPVLSPVTLQAEAGPLLPALRAALSPVPDSPAPFSGDDCARLLLRAAEKQGGLLLLVDELGKFLEHAARSGEDPFLLQQLAEAAARSEAPIVFLGALHSGFSRYLGEAGGGAPERRAEWQKAEGRFHDLPFALPDQQALDLLGRAVRWNTDAETSRPVHPSAALDLLGRAVRWNEASEQRWRERARKVAEDAGRLPGEADRLAACAPLHPLTALLLWPLFRSRAAQNERSLFSFLTSHEPHGFRDFLERETIPANGSAPPLFRLPELWNYAAGSLGSAAFAGADGRKWSLAAEALDRLNGSSPPLAAEVVKATALLGLFGDRPSLAADRSTLEAALDDAGTGEVGEAIAHLEERSVLVWRRHRGAFALWEGSDLDLDAALRRALGERGPEPLAHRLARAATPRPLAARAHSVETGALRWFEPRLAGGSDDEVQEELATPTEADGVVLFVVPEGDPERAVRTAESASRRRLGKSGAGGSKPLLTAVLENGSELAEGLAEVEGWQRVWQTTPDLAGDAAARKEAVGREEAARRRFESAAGPALGLPGHVLDPSRADWYYRGEKRQPKNPRELQALLSRICNQTYSKAPRLENELLNRRTLSSAAAAGRRNLIARILEDAESERLGIEGFPPEFSMFRSLVDRGGFVSRKPEFRLRKPPRASTWRPAWEAVAAFVRKADDAPRSVAELAALLEAPPFGLRPGPFPVLLALFLRVEAGKTAFYEDGVFLPGPDTAAFERLLRRPETFALRSFRAKKHGEKGLIEAVCAEFDIPTKRTDNFGKLLIRGAQHLVGQAVRLPPFARQTAQLGEPARRVRDALLTARDPWDLFFRDLPQATGFKDLDPAFRPTRGFRNTVEEIKKPFARSLGDAVAEVEEALPQMLASLEKEIAAGEGFGAPLKGDELGRHLAEVGVEFAGQAPDTRLRLLLEAAERAGAGGDWRRTIATRLADGLPPERWNDDLAETARRHLRIADREVARLRTLGLGTRTNGGVPTSRVETLVLSWKEAAEGFSPAEQKKATEFFREYLVASGVSP